MLVPVVAAPVVEPITTAVVGAGFIARGLVHRIARRSTLAPPLIVARRPEPAVAILDRAGYAVDAIVHSDDAEVLGEAIADGRPAVTTDAEALPEVAGVQVVVEATGAMEYGAAVMQAALLGRRHVVSMNAEVDSLLGHHLHALAVRSGVTYTIADGDQPGVVLRMIDEAHQLGLEVAVALNCKRNLNVYQNQADSRPYAERDGTSVAMTTAFGDGTKMQIENAVIANLSGLVPPPLGTSGVRTELARVAEDVRAAGIAEGSVHFTLGGDFGGGVIVLARSSDPDFDAPYLRYGKLGDGPWYPLFRPYHLIHMEMATTIEQVAAGGPALGRRTPEPVAVCAAVAKRELAAGDALDGIGGDTCYGVAASVAEGAGLLPIGLSQHATVRRPVTVDQPLTLDDVELDDDAFLVKLAGSGRLAASEEPA